MNLNTFDDKEPAVLAGDIISGELDIDDIYCWAKESEQWSGSLIKTLNNLYIWLMVHHYRKADHYGNLQSWLLQCGDMIIHFKLMLRLMRKQASLIELDMTEYRQRWQFYLQYFELCQVHLEHDESDEIRTSYPYVIEILTELHHASIEQNNKSKQDKSDDSKMGISEKDLFNSVVKTSDADDKRYVEFKANLQRMRHHGLIEMITVEDELRIKLGFRHFNLIDHDAEYRLKIFGESDNPQREGVSFDVEGAFRMIVLRQPAGDQQTNDDVEETFVSPFSGALNEWKYDVKEAS